METAPAPGAVDAGSGRRPGAAGHRSAALVPVEPRGEARPGRSAHGGLLPPLLPRRRRRGASAVVRHQGATEPVGYGSYVHVELHSQSMLLIICQLLCFQAFKCYASSVLIENDVAVIT